MWQIVKSEIDEPGNVLSAERLEGSYPSEGAAIEAAKALAKNHFCHIWDMQKNYWFVGDEIDDQFREWRFSIEPFIRTDKPDHTSIEGIA